MTNSNFIFGYRSIIEAINAGKEIDKVILKKGSSGELYKELFDLVRQNEIPYQMVPVEKLNRITQKNHQGAIGFICPIEYQNMEEVLIRVFESAETPLMLVLDGITDVRNFGAIARSAKCAGVHAIVVPDKGSAVINADAIKTSAGALHEIPVCRVKSIGATIDYLLSSGLKIACATEKGSDVYYKCDFTGPMAIVMGAEDTGISHSVLRKADILCQIPIQGSIGSLNVSVAAGILMFDVVRQREN